MDSDLVNAGWVAYLCATLATLMYLDKHAHAEGMRLPARFSIQFAIVLCGLLFWLTWPAIWLRRLKQVWRP